MSEGSKPPLFPVARDDATEPGIGLSLDALALQRECMRLRQERTALRKERDDAFEALDRATMPPTPRQRLAGLGAGAVSVLGVLSLVVALAAQVAAVYRPDIEAPLRTLEKLLGSLG